MALPLSDLLLFGGGEKKLAACLLLLLLELFMEGELNYINSYNRNKHLLITTV